MDNIKIDAKYDGIRQIALVKQSWVNIVLIILAIVVICLGAYFYTHPQLGQRADIKLYNQGVLSYLDAPSNVLPATAERPEEFYTVRAAFYFQQAVTASKDNRIISLALYNSGTLMGIDYLTSKSSLTPAFGIVDAIDKLAEAVRTDPNNEDAKYNLELLEKVQAALAKSSLGFFTSESGTSVLGGGSIAYGAGSVHKGF